MYEHNGLIEERIYLGGWEIYRKRLVSAPEEILLERETLHMMDGVRRIAMVETKTIDEAAGGAFQVATVTRFQMGNHLGSAALEVDAGGLVISYEEYHPYGTTAYWSASGAVEVSKKRYRYTGKEKDEETGLYYHGARYYAPWLGRWTAADPAGLVDGVGVYTYVNDNPVRLLDPSGTTGDEHDDVIDSAMQSVIANNQVSLGLMPQSSEQAAAQRAAWTASRKRAAPKATSSQRVKPYSPSAESLPSVAPVYHVNTHRFSGEALFGGCICLPQRLIDFIANAPAEGIAAGEHGAKAVLHAQRGESDEAVLSGLEAVRSEADAAGGFLSVGSLIPSGAGKATVHLSGAAQNPKTAPFAPNAAGPRTIDEAVELTRSLGVDIPDDVKFYAREGLVPEGADATYLTPGRVSADKVYEWESLYNRFGKIPVKVRPEVLHSDEHAVAVISHEMFELNNLRRLFDELPSAQMTARELGRNINPDIPGNLHDRAWDFADKMVRTLRSRVRSTQ